MILTVYFSGTGNTKYVAESFSAHMGGKCLSIEDEADFTAEFSAADTIAFCYPNYASRVPLIMRQFAERHSAGLRGKKLVILVMQWVFSGDCARVFTDLFPKGHFDVIYAEHFAMPNNVNNLFLFPKASENSLFKRFKEAENKVSRVCKDIKNSIVRRRGFSIFGRFLGSIQGRLWQGKSSSFETVKGSGEHRMKNSIKIHKHCTVCELCVTVCPMKNLETKDGTIIHKNNCTVCYRCVNLCPQRAITIFFHGKPKWQYQGILKQ